MPRTWKAALAPFLAGIPGADRLCRRGPLRPAQRPALGRARAAAHDRQLRRAGAAEGRAACPPTGRCPNCRCPPPRSRPGGSGSASRRRPSGRGARARRGRAVEALAAAYYAELARAARGRGQRGLGARRPGREGARGRDRRRRRPSASATSPAPICATPSWRSRRPTPRCRTIPACCTSRPRSARRRSASSGRPARGTGRRSIRSPRVDRDAERARLPAVPQADLPPGAHRCMRDIPAEQVLRPRRATRWPRRSPRDCRCASKRSARARSITSSTDGASPLPPTTSIGPCPTGPCCPGSLPAKIADQRHAERGGEMQQPGIDADDERRAARSARHAVERLPLRHAALRPSAAAICVAAPRSRSLPQGSTQRASPRRAARGPSAIQAPAGHSFSGRAVACSRTP